MKYNFTKPIYDVTKSWEYNYEHGPNFTGPFPPLPKEKKWQLLDHKLISPLGVAAGPLPNYKWMSTYLKLGYGSIIQKTVRSTPHKSHKTPNIAFVKRGQKLKLDKNPIILERKINNSIENLTITNSFGNPCKSPKNWQNEAIKTKKIIETGQIFGISVYGTAEMNTTLDELAEDYALTAELAMVASPDFIEANLACPNVSGAENPFLYKDSKAVSKIAKAIKTRINKTPLVFKIGFFEDYRDLLDVLKNSKGHFEAVSAINTIQKRVVNSKGEQILPGRNYSGICGAQIKPFAIEMVKNLVKAKKDVTNFEIIGVGGVMTPRDVQDFLDAGADHVQSATAVMFNPYLAYEFSQKYPRN